MVSVLKPIVLIAVISTLSTCALQPVAADEDFSGAAKLCGSLLEKGDNATCTYGEIEMYVRRVTKKDRFVAKLNGYIDCLSNEHRGEQQCLRLWFDKEDY